MKTITETAIELCWIFHQKPTPTMSPEQYWETTGELQKDGWLRLARFGRRKALNREIQTMDTIAHIIGITTLSIDERSAELAQKIKELGED